MFKKNKNTQLVHNKSYKCIHNTYLKSPPISFPITIKNHNQSKYSIIKEKQSLKQYQKKHEFDGKRKVNVHQRTQSMFTENNQINNIKKQQINGKQDNSKHQRYTIVEEIETPTFSEIKFKESQANSKQLHNPNLLMNKPTTRQKSGNILQLDINSTKQVLEAQTYQMWLKLQQQIMKNRQLMKRYNCSIETNTKLKQCNKKHENINLLTENQKLRTEILMWQDYLHDNSADSKFSISKNRNINTDASKHLIDKRYTYK